MKSGNSGLGFEGLGSGVCFTAESLGLELRVPDLGFKL